MKINIDNWNIGTFETILIIIFLPMFLWFSFWLFISGLKGLFRMIKSKKFINTIGKIIETELKFKIVEDDDIILVIEKTYVYKVDNKEFQSKNNLISDSLFSKDYKNIDKLPKSHNYFFKTKTYLENLDKKENLLNKEVKVYYDKQNPIQSCLETGVKYFILFPIFMGFFFGGALLYVTYYILSSIIEF